jgi:hypothetical protein
MEIGDQVYRSGDDGEVEPYGIVVDPEDLTRDELLEALAGQFVVRLPSGEC